MSRTIKNFTVQYFPSSGVPLLLALREQSNVEGALGLCAVTTAPTSTRRVLSTSPRCSKTSRKPWSLGYSWFIIDIATLQCNALVGDWKEISNGNGLKAQNYSPSDQPAWQLWREVQALGSGEFVCCLYKCWFVCWCLRLFIKYFTMVACCSSTCTSIAHVSLLLCQICQLLGNICVANLDLRKVVKLLKGKSSKNATFNNATEMLAKALGYPYSC